MADLVQGTARGIRRGELRRRPTTYDLTSIREATQLLSTFESTIGLHTPKRNNKGEIDHHALIQINPMALATATPARALCSCPTASRQPAATAIPHSVGLPSLPLPPQFSSSALHFHGRGPWKSASYCRRIARNVVAMATGAPAEVAIELPEIVKTIQEAWDKLEDKYAVTSLAFFILIALYGSAGMISAIDRLPLLPNIFELIGIGYTGWFAYRNFVFKPDREALIAKIKNIYSDVIGSS